MLLKADSDRVLHLSQRMPLLREAPEGRDLPRLFTEGAEEARRRRLLSGSSRHLDSPGSRVRRLPPGGVHRRRLRPIPRRALLGGALRDRVGHIVPAVFLRGRRHTPARRLERLGRRGPPRPLLLDAAFRAGRSDGRRIGTDRSLRRGPSGSGQRDETAVSAGPGPRPARVGLRQARRPRARLARYPVRPMGRGDLQAGHRRRVNGKTGSVRSVLACARASRALSSPAWHHRW